MTSCPRAVSRLNRVRKVCTAIAPVLVAAGCGGESWPFREPVAAVALSYRAPVGEQVVFDMALFVNDGPGEVELREIAVPAGSGFELLDTRVVIAPLGAVPDSGGRTPDSIPPAGP